MIGTLERSHRIQELWYESIESVCVRMKREKNKSDTAFVMGVYYRRLEQVDATDEAFLH